NGPSMPSAANTADNLRRRGHAPNIDTGPLDAISTHFARVARAEGHPVGAPREYSVAIIDQELPGGMSGTLRNQLVQYGMAHRLDEVLEEVTVVRAEMGYPIMATPYSPLFGLPATRDVLNRHR